MRKLLFILTVFICFNAAGQKKDSTAYDTVYVFRAADINALKSIIMNSKIIGEDNQPFTGIQLIQLLNWMENRKTLIPKTKK